MMESPGDNFDRLAENIASNVKKIHQNVVSMTKMVSQRQTPQDSQELRTQLRQIQSYTQKLATDTSSLLMQLMKMPTTKPAEKLTRERLSDEYMSTLNSFQAIQKRVAEYTKEDVRKVKSQYAHVSDPFKMGTGSSSSVKNDLMVMDDVNELRNQEQLTMQTERSLVELEERERDMRQLESDIMDVNQIFKELGTTIHSQGEVVDSIESSVNYTAQNIENGALELRQAATYKNKMRKKKVYIGLALIVIISIILIIIFHK